MDHVVDLLLGPLGLTIGLIFALFAGWRGWWVWGKDMSKCEKERDFWREAALRGTELAEKAVSMKERNGR